MAAAKPARAYMTFLAGDGDESFKRVVWLAKYLRKAFGSAYPLVVAVLPGVPESRRAMLVSQGCIVRVVKPVHPPAQCAFATAEADDDYIAKHSMVRIWELVEYERVVSLDPNIIPLLDIDDLFELDKGRFYAVAVVDSSDTAERVVPPALCSKADDDMLVYEPSMATAKSLLEALHGRAPPPPRPLTDQQSQDDFLRMFFGDQYKRIRLDNKPVLDKDEVLVNLPHDGNAGDYAELAGRDLLPDGALAERLRRLLPFAATVAFSAVVNGLAAGPGSTAVGFGLSTLFLGGAFLVILHVLRA